MFPSARSAKPNRIYSLKMSKTADFDTTFYIYIHVYMVGGYSPRGGECPSPPHLNETLIRFPINIRFVDLGTCTQVWFGMGAHKLCISRESLAVIPLPM